MESGFSQATVGISTLSDINTCVSANAQGVDVSAWTRTTGNGVRRVNTALPAPGDQHMYELANRLPNVTEEGWSTSWNA